MHRGCSGEKKRKKWAAVIVLLLLCLFFIECLYSKDNLEISRYELSIDNNSLRSAVRIVHLSDVHGAVFGKENTSLISEIDTLEPDVIVITGDMVNSRNGLGTTETQELLTRLVAIAPVYISFGNQEMSLIDDGADVKSDYENAGAVVLDNSFVDVTIKGNHYRIGGIYGYCQPAAYSIETNRENESEFLIDYQSTDACKLLLCHMPVSWINSYSLYDWDVDVVFSGHAHGGQIRLPLIGGLWAPDQGWFPGQVCGVYRSTKEGWIQSRAELSEYANNLGYDTSYYDVHDTYEPSALVLSRGLGNTDWVPRFNNPPEIVVVDLVPES